MFLIPYALFYQVNFLVVLYGLFQGLVFLPVMLSWLGPAPYADATPRGEQGAGRGAGAGRGGDAEAGHKTDFTVNI